MNRSRGFTLAELMVVIGIIALLVAILMPTYSSTSSEARRIMCLNNLNKINQATHTWATRSQSWDQRALAEGGWTAAVENLTNGHEVLRCPEGGPLAEGSPVESLIVIRTSPTSNVGIPLLEMNKDGGFAGQFKILKLSTTQFNLAEGKKMTPVPYVPDGNPNQYYWGYDDGAIGSGDYDFQDLYIRVTKNGDGTASLFVLAETGGNPEVWSPDLKICYAKTEDINKHHYSGKGVEAKLNVGGATHYGMNNARIDMRRLDKIQVLDYPNAIAASTDNWDVKEWDKDKDGRPDFLRHNGRLNAATLGGSARTYFRWQLDPADIEVDRTLWEK
jgi:prepilin-type N-terminal cleavage/methylation domain-containing protein